MKERADGADGYLAMRVDASTEIGTGHVMRCLALADRLALHNLSTRFVCRHLPQQLEQRIRENGHGLTRLHTPDTAARTDGDLYAQMLKVSTAQDAQDTLAALETDGGQAGLRGILVDHYGLGKDWHDVVRTGQKGALCAFDDLLRSHDVDVLVDTTFGREAQDYRGKVGPDCHLLCGSAYAVLRPDFAALRPSTLAARDADFADARPPRSILVAMGGSDGDDATGFVARALLPHAERLDLTIIALVGGAYPHLDALDNLAAGSGGRLDVRAQVKDVAALLAGSDLCIGASGTSTWERCCLGLPTINLILADNQRTIDRALGEIGAIIPGGTYDSGSDNGAQGASITTGGEKRTAAQWADDIVLPALSSPAKLAALSHVSRAIVDGHGAARVAGAVLAQMVRGAAVVLDKASRSDAALIHAWQAFPETRRFAGSPDIPSWQDHLAWMERRLADESSYFYIARACGLAVGMVRLDPTTAPEPDSIPDAAQLRDISILTAPGLYGCGIGIKMLHALQEQHGDIVQVARVLPRNKASMALFAKAGFRQYAPEYHVWQRPDRTAPHNRETPS